MTEAEWLACRAPWRLLDYHQMKKRPRQLRLLAAGCARQVVPADGPLVAVIDVVERYADGTATRAEFLAARKAVRKAIRDKVPRAQALASLADDEMEGLTVTVERTRGRSGGPIQCALIRCIFPFRPVSLSPEWHTGTAVALAAQMFESRDFSAMPILADALQDAGCDNPDILNHCRCAVPSPADPAKPGPQNASGPHTRGCWVLDQLLGKR